MGRFKTFTNSPAAGKDLLPSDLNAIQDDLELAFSTYKNLRTLGGADLGDTQVTAAGTYLLRPNQSVAILATSPASYFHVFHFDPADFAAAGPAETPRVTKLRLKASYLTNGTQSSRTTTVGLYPVSAISGGQVTLGTVVSGSTVAFANPAINTRSQANSGDFTAPSAGYFLLAAAVAGGAFAAGAVAAVSVALQLRQV